MARKANTAAEKLITKLKVDVIKIAGFPIINPVDCEQLSDVIFRKTKFYISSVTLKRFMGFYKSGFQSSYQTLDILSIYCGYDGWSNFIKPAKEKVTVTSEELTFFNSIFNLKDYTTVLDHDETMQMLARRIAERLREDPKAFEKIIPDLAKNKLAQIFYFEHFPDYDNLVAYQYKGYIEYLKHKTSAESQIFGNCLLFFRAFLLQEKKLMKHYYDVLIKIEVPIDMHTMPLGRYYQCLILYCHFVDEKPIANILKHIFAIEKRLPRIGLHFTNFPGFHYFIADALQLCGYNKEVLKLIDLATKNYKICREFVWKGYYRQLQLLMAEAHYSLGHKQKALNLIDKIRPKQFYFISRNYFTLRYNVLKLNLGIANNKEKKEIKMLINISHFDFFNKLKN